MGKSWELFRNKIVYELNYFEYKIIEKKSAYLFVVSKAGKCLYSLNCLSFYGRRLCSQVLFRALDIANPNLVVMVSHFDLLNQLFYNSK